MDLKPQRVLQGMAGAVMFLAIVAGAQTTPAPTPASSRHHDSRHARSRAGYGPVWSVGTMDLSGFVDGYFSYNHNRPASQTFGPDG